MPHGPFEMANQAPEIDRVQKDGIFRGTLPTNKKVPRSVSVIAILGELQTQSAKERGAGCCLSESGVLYDCMPLSRDFGLEGRFSADFMRFRASIRIGTASADC